MRAARCCEYIGEEVLIGIDAQFNSGIFQIELFEKGILVEVHLHKTHLFFTHERSDRFAFDIEIMRRLNVRHRCMGDQGVVFEAIVELIQGGHRRGHGMIRFLTLYGTIDKMPKIDIVQRPS